MGAGVGAHSPAQVANSADEKFGDVVGRRRVRLHHRARKSRDNRCPHSNGMALWFVGFGGTPASPRNSSPSMAMDTTSDGAWTGRGVPCVASEPTSLFGGFPNLPSRPLERTGRMPVQHMGAPMRWSRTETGDSLNPLGRPCPPLWGESARLGR